MADQTSDEARDDAHDDNDESTEDRGGRDGAAGDLAALGVLDLLQRSAALFSKDPMPMLKVAAVPFLPAALLHAAAHATILRPSRAAAATGFIFYGLALPLAQAALTMLAADRLAGGGATWKDVWARLGRRLGTLLSAVLPAALLIAVGSFLLYLPGVAAAVLLSLVPSVALFERRGGPAALRRSAELVAGDWLRVALTLLSFVLLRAAGAIVAGLLLPATLFGTQLVHDLVSLVTLPIPAVALMLLYLDIRRRRDGADERRLLAELAPPR